MHRLGEEELKKIGLGQAIAILANLGVIAGIVFLAVELQQNNQLLAAQARSDLAARRSSFVEMIASSPDLAEIIVRASSGESLTPAEELRFQHLGQRLFDSFQTQFLEVQTGVVSEDSLPIRQWRRLYHAPLGPDYLLPEHWERYRTDAEPDFARFIEETVIAPGPP